MKVDKILVIEFSRLYLGIKKRIKLRFGWFFGLILNLK